MELESTTLAASHLAMAMTEMSEGKTVASMWHGLMAVGFAWDNHVVLRPLYLFAVVFLALECRALGSIGYAFKAFDRVDIAVPLLSFHYGLMSFDAADEPSASRTVHGVMALTYAMSLPGKKSELEGENDVRGHIEHDRYA